MSKIFNEIMGSNSLTRTEKITKIKNHFDGISYETALKMVDDYTKYQNDKLRKERYTQFAKEIREEFENTVDDTIHSWWGCCEAKMNPKETYRNLTDNDVDVIYKIYSKACYNLKEVE